MSFVERFLDLLLGEGRRHSGSTGVREPENPEPEIHYEDIPGTLDLGWRYSEGRNEFQMAKVGYGDRATHMYVIGATGAGKTKFLESLIQQDIRDRNGFAIIDPHGDLVEDVKGFLANAYMTGTNLPNESSWSIRLTRNSLSRSTHWSNFRG